MRNVDWEQFLPHEKLLAYSHAKRRATAALKQYVGLLEPSRTPLPNEPVTLKTFSYYEDESEYESEYESGDEDEDEDKKTKYPPGVLDMENLPGIDDPNLASHPQLFRTTVALAMIYHDIESKNGELADDAARWQLFLGWLHKPESPEILAKPLARARTVRALLIGGRMLKEGARYIADAMNKGIAEYQALQNRNNVAFNFRHPDDRKEINGPEFFSTPPKEWPDICTMSSQDIKALPLYPCGPNIVPPKEGWNEEDRGFACVSDDEDAEPTHEENFRRGLAFRASSLNQLQELLARARGREEQRTRAPNP
jgi:hypothetical protein